MPLRIDRQSDGRRSKCDGSPIVILASGERSGSTLVQRYLCSHPGVHIWGEFGGAFEAMVSLVKELENRSIRYSGVADRYATEGTREFIANLMPPAESALSALRSFVEAFLAGTWSRWGFKEVRWSEGLVHLISRSFPEARFLGIIRDIHDSLGSLLAWGWSKEACVEFCERWICQTKTLLESNDGRLLRLRYEDLGASAGTARAKIPEFLGLSPDSFDAKVFGFRVADHQRRGVIEQEGPRVAPRLPNWAKSLVSTPEVSSIRREAGYLSFYGV